MIKTWIADVRPLLEKDKYYQYYNTLPSWRKEKADRIKTPLIRAQSVGVWTLWDLMRESFNLEDASIRNFSHSGDYVLCAAEITGSPYVKLGCDIEKVERKDKHLEKFAKRFFCHSEHQAILQCDTLEEKRELFYRFWALKESYVKATGMGMAIDTRSVEVNLGSTVTLLKQPKKYSDNYQLWELHIFDLPYKIAVCTTDTEVDEALEQRIF